ncbi:SAM-dependent methyltransferase, partial [Vibrio parahaemolyticus]|uniref:methyltransferase n=1 Tax=Vibrio parahaemolyticus TaxID=670 RepID=UPI001AC952B3|nr:SAM-dependent methyltransferase [Vibrio parahaemolyticus]
DRSFPLLLIEVFARMPKHLVDIGGNTGKWAIQCCKQDPDVQVTIVDLPQPLEVAMKNVSENQFVERVRPYPANMLDKAQTLPEHADVW